MSEKISLINGLIGKYGYKAREIIGAGSFGSVFLVESEKYQTDFVAKAIPLGSSAESERELKVLTHLNHPNIISVFESFIEDNVNIIIFEYCPGGSCQDVVHACPGAFLEPQRLYCLAHQILRALDHCHTREIAHRDIKPANILLDKYGRPKLADFGLSQLREEFRADDRSVSGTRTFMAPEVLCGKCKDLFAADIWALGITFYVIATGSSPWPPNATFSELKAAIRLGMVAYPHDLDVGFANLLRDMIVLQPSMRKTTKELLENPVFKGLTDTDITAGMEKRPNAINMRSRTSTLENRRFSLYSGSAMSLLTSSHSISPTGRKLRMKTFASGSFNKMQNTTSIKPLTFTAQNW